MTTKLIAMAALSNPFRLTALQGAVLGKEWLSKADAGTNDSQPLTEAWGLRPGVYTPRQLVEGFAPLLDTVVFRLGSDPPEALSARNQLLDNIVSNLATDTREATLRLSEPLDVSRREIKEQAIRIGHSLVQWARDSSSKSIDPELYLRSPCEGHLLTKPNVDLMFGDRSQPHLMQLFNEYMHQMVLLRDALLPFQNYEEVLIPVPRKGRGLRHLEQARTQFLADVLVKSTTQRSVVQYAKALLAPGLLDSSQAIVGYGFQYANGTILPAFLGGGSTPLHLLRYIPTKFDTATSDILFDYRFEDYYSAPRLEIPTGTVIQAVDLGVFSKREDIEVQSSSIEMVRDSPVDPAQLKLCLKTNGESVNVDVGQVSRGHRYSYLAQDSSLDGHAVNVDDKPWGSAIAHDPLDILRVAESGLVTSKEGGVHIIPTNNPLIALALLGKLYPENVVLLPADEELKHAQSAGKGFEAKFVIWGGSSRGGLKGNFQGFSDQSQSK